MEVSLHASGDAKVVKTNTNIKNSQILTHILKKTGASFQKMRKPSWDNRWRSQIIMEPAELLHFATHKKFNRKFHFNFFVCAPSIAIIIKIFILLTLILESVFIYYNFYQFYLWKSCHKRKKRTVFYFSFYVKHKPWLKQSKNPDKIRSKLL
jgi:hypothetical protein